MVMQEVNNGYARSTACVRSGTLVTRSKQRDSLRKRGAIPRAIQAKKLFIDEKNTPPKTPTHNEVEPLPKTYPYRPVDEKRSRASLQQHQTDEPRPESESRRRTSRVSGMKRASANLNCHV